MKNVLANSHNKFFLISSLCVIVLMLINSLLTLNTQPNNSNRVSLAHIVNKESSPTSIIPFEKLQYQPKFGLQDSSPSFHLITDSSHTSKKSKVLHTILNNNQKRKKFEYVLQKANELKLPAELALIPVIESAYNTKAVSYKGAGGIWQLMPGTARIYGVSSKQRFEMQSSTEAALLYFKKLHKKFGNWEFAIAAYNAGDGRVSKALRKNTHAKTIRDLKLPRETRNYVLSFYQLKKELSFSNVANSIEPSTV